MEFQGLLQKLPNQIKTLIGVFLIVLSVGFYTGLSFVSKTSSASPHGIETHYLGNEDDEDAELMKFKKSDGEMLSIIHSHILSMALIFFVVALILGMTSMRINWLKNFLMIEPLISVLLTFGCLYFLWSGLLWMKYIVALSGGFMVVSYTVSILIIFYDLTFKKPIS